MTEPQVQTVDVSQDLNFYVGIFKNRWWLILLTGLVCGCLMYLLSVSQTPVYESQLRMIKTGDLRAYSRQSGAAGVNDVQASFDPALTAEEIIKSRAVIQRAIGTQPLFAGQDPRQMQVLATTDKLNPILNVSYRDSSAERVQIFLNSLAKSFIETDLESRRAAARQAIEYLEATLPQARRSLKIAQDEYQEFLKRNAEIQPSQLQAALSNNSLGLDQELQKQRLDLQQIQGTRARLYSRVGVGEDEALATLAISSDVTYQQLISQYQTQRADLEKLRITFQEAHPQVEGVKKQIATTEKLMRDQLDTVLADALFRKTNVRTGVLKNKPLVDNTLLGADNNTNGVAEASDDTPVELTPTNPVRNTLTNQLVDVETRLATTQASIRAVEGAKGAVRGRLDGLSAKVIEESNLKNQVERGLLKFNNLTQRVEEYRLAAVQQVSPWSVLDPAELPGIPIAPKPTNNGLFGLAGGLVLGFLLAYYLELSNNKLRRKEDIQRVLGVPFLGYVPYSTFVKNVFQGEGNQEQAPQPEQAPRSRGNNLLAKILRPFRGRRRSAAYGGAGYGGYGGYRYGYGGSYASSVFSESFRRIATRLLFSRPEEELRTICITSCIPGEGKSTCSLNIANALVEMGKRVLLVDADLRRPSVHTLVGIPNRIGLSVMLTSSSVTPSQVVQKDMGRMDFGIITSGPIVPNPVALLSSQRLPALLTTLKEDYDIVLIDTPPSMAFADSQIIASYVDAVVFVVSRGVLKPQFLADVRNGFGPQEKKLLGFVVNSTSEDSMDETFYQQEYYDYYTYKSSREAERSVPD